MNKYISAMLGLLLIFVIVYLVNLSHENEALRSTLISTQEHVIELENEKGMVEAEFQVEDVRECRTHTLEILEMQATLNRKREYKDVVCGEVINKPVDILNPTGYYDVVEQDNGVFVAIPKFE